MASTAKLIRNLAAPVRRQRSSSPMRIHFANAFYGVVDYVAYPAGMLAVAPIAIRALGIDRYGIWMVANSAISIGAIIASGFGDANIRYVAMERASRQSRFSLPRRPQHAGHSSRPGDHAGDGGLAAGPGDDASTDYAGFGTANRLPLVASHRVPVDAGASR